MKEYPVKIGKLHILMMNRFVWGILLSDDELRIDQLRLASFRPLVLLTRDLVHLVREVSVRDG